MKKAILIGYVIIVLLVTGAGVSRGDSGCIKVKGISSGETVTPDFFGGAPFVGEASLETSAGPLTAEVMTFLTGPPVEHGNATFASTRHVFEVKDALNEEVVFFRTDDMAVLPLTGQPGLLRLNSRLAIADGVWATDPPMSASGKLVVNGTLQLIPGAGPEDPTAALAEWNVKGRLCAEDE